MTISNRNEKKEKKSTTAPGTEDGIETKSKKHEERKEKEEKGNENVVIDSRGHIVTEKVSLSLSHSLSRARTLGVSSPSLSVSVICTQRALSQYVYAC